MQWQRRSSSGGVRRRVKRSQKWVRSLGFSWQKKRSKKDQRANRLEGEERRCSFQPFCSLVVLSAFFPSHLFLVPLDIYLSPPPPPPPMPFFSPISSLELSLLSCRHPRITRRVGTDTQGHHTRLTGCLKRQRYLHSIWDVFMNIRGFNSAGWVIRHSKMSYPVDRAAAKWVPSNENPQ